MLSDPNAFYDLLLDYAGSTAVVEQITLGLVWTHCRSAAASGLAMSPGSVTRTLPWAGTLAGRTLSELAGWVRAWDPHQAAIGLAACNCVLNSRRLPHGSSLVPHNAAANLTVFEHFLPQLAGKKVVVVGRYPGIERLADTVELTVLERQPQTGDLPDPAAEYLLPRADWVFLTASSIANKTFPRLVQLAQPATTVLMGPSTPWLPELREFGIDYLAGIEVADAGILQQTVAEGGGVRIFDRAVRYRIVALQPETDLEWLKQQIAATFADKQQLDAAMAAWYGAGRNNRFPDYRELEAVGTRLSRLDSAYKRLWDQQQAERR